MRETFSDMLRRVLSHQDYTEGLEEYFGSPHMRTKIIRQPQKATHAQLLHLSHITGIDASTLLDEWEVGAEKVSELEKENLKKLASMEAEFVAQ